ncbi:hypothetical protein U1Q18_013409 [Sarracenia purpurea var. burkii]
MNRNRASGNPKLHISGTINLADLSTTEGSNRSNLHQWVRDYPMKSPKAPQTPGRSEESCSYGQTMIAGGNSSSPTHENLDGFLEGDSLDNDLSPLKRNKEDFDTRNQAKRSPEDQNSVETDCVSNLHGVNKLKNDVNSANQHVAQCTFNEKPTPTYSRSRPLGRQQKQ